MPSREQAHPREVLKELGLDDEARDDLIEMVQWIKSGAYGYPRTESYAVAFLAMHYCWEGTEISYLPNSVGEKFCEFICDELYGRSASHPEYAWFIYNALDVDMSSVWWLVRDDVAGYLTRVRNVCDTLVERGIVSSAIGLRCLREHMQTNFGELYVESEDKTAEEVKKLTAARNAGADALMISLRDNVFNWTRISRQADLPVWDCPTADYLVPPVALGTKCVVNNDVAIARFCEFTCGLDPRDEDFPRGCVFAGGLVTKAVASNWDPEYGALSDVDVFILGATNPERVTIVDALLAYMRRKFGKHVWFSVYSSVITVYVLNVKRNFQIISNDATSEAEIVGNFDMTHIQWLFNGTEFKCTPAAAEAMVTSTTNVFNAKRLRHQRLVKAISGGWAVAKTDLILLANVNMDEICANKDVLSEIASQSFVRMYFPEAEVSPTGEISSIARTRIAECIKANRCELVTQDPLDAITNYVVGADFGATPYASLDTAWNPGAISSRPFIERQNADVDLRQVAKLHKCVHGGVAKNKDRNRRPQNMYKHTIVANADVMKLYEQLKTVVGGLVRASNSKAVDKTEYPQMGKPTTLYIHQNRYPKVHKDKDADGNKDDKESPRAKHQKPFLVDQHGNALDMEELHPSDIITPVVTMTCHRNNDDFWFVITVIKVIKHVIKYMPTGSAADADVAADVEAELARVGASPEDTPADDEDTPANEEVASDAEEDASDADEDANGTEEDASDAEEDADEDDEDAGDSDEDAGDSDEDAGDSDEDASDDEEEVVAPVKKAPAKAAPRTIKAAPVRAVAPVRAAKPVVAKPAPVVAKAPAPVVAKAPAMKKPGARIAKPVAKGVAKAVAKKPAAQKIEYDDIVM